MHRCFGPATGTKARLMYELMLRPEGASGELIAQLTGRHLGYHAYARDFAATYGLGYRSEGHGKTARYWLFLPKDRR